ncbi:MAG TPA: phospholipase C, phosphocholine-specific [Steroidobacteraceae bacterium]|nr:phospholipase C, phosphocholine-specific [Steroidobacteraceae bacterium]
MSNERKTDRRQFLQLMGLGAAASTLHASIAKALAIPANYRTGTIQDVEHIVILMQENNSFDKYFGTLQGVRGFSDPRPAGINLPLAGGTGTVEVPVFLQPAGAANVAAGYAVPPNYGNLGGPANGAPVLPPFRFNPESFPTPTDSLGLIYLPGTDHSWPTQHGGWNQGQWDGWPVSKGPVTMAYLKREDIPYHYALADAFTIGDGYHCSVLGPTNPNRYYLWTGCIGNVDYLPNGVDGVGGPPTTGNGLENGQYYLWQTFPEVLQAAGISWKIYQDLAGSTFAGDFGGGGPTSFAGTYQDNPVLYFNQYYTAPSSSPLFQNGVAGASTNITGSNSTIPASGTMPASGASTQEWQTWAEGLFAKFKADVQNNTLPQVSWFVSPAGFSEHPDWPSNYGAWYTSQILDILTSNPELFSKTVLLVNFDENDGGFDHVVSPTPPQSTDGSDGASTVSTANEVLTAAQASPPGPIGLGARVPFLAISPWSKGGYVNSQVFDHTSVIQFIERRFGVYEQNITPWRRAVAGDLTSVFNFESPNAALPPLPDTSGYLPPGDELAGGSPTTDAPSVGASNVIIGLPTQEPGIRRARALPYELEVLSSVSGSTVSLKFINTGGAAAVFQVRSTNTADVVRNYTVEPGKMLSGTWTATAAGTYNLSVYGPNGFVRSFQGSTGAGAAALMVSAAYDKYGFGSLGLNIVNSAGTKATVSVLDAYTGATIPAFFHGHGDSFAYDWSLEQFYGWYDLIVTVQEDPTFRYRFAGHVETGRDSFSDPALGGHVLTTA